MELYILSKQDLSILSICKLADYQINLDEETNAKSTFTLMKTNGLKKENYMVLNGLYRQFIFVIDDVQTEKESDVVTVTALDISNVFNRKVIEKNIDTMKSKSIEEFLANTISENFVNSDDTALNVNYIEIYWHTNTQGNVATNAENGLYNFHTFLTNCRQYKNIYTDFKLENLGNPQTVEGKRISLEAKNRKIVDISLHGESTQKTRSGKNKFNYEKASNVSNTFVSTYRLFEISDLEPNTQYTISGYDITGTTTAYIYFWSGNTYDNSSPRYFFSSPSSYNTAKTITFTSNAEGKIYLAMYETTEAIWNEFIQKFKNAQIEEGSIATDYEEYGVMPSPDYPSPIENIEGNIEVKVEGKNLQNTNLRNGIYNANTGEYSANSNYLANIDIISVKPNTSYSFSSDLGYSFEAYLYDKNKQFIARAFATDNAFTTSEETYYINWRTLTSGQNNLDCKVQLEFGEPSDYEPYKSQVATFPLGEEKLMEGSYLADDGVHNVRGQVVFDGSDDEDWQIESTNNFYSNIVIQNTKDSGLVLCNYQKSTKKQLGESENCFISGSRKFNFQSDTINHTVADFKTWLSTHNLIVEYKLAEEETVPYTEEQQEAWDKIKNLTLFEGVNHISSDANMVLKYYPLKPVGLKFVLRIDIENKQETTELIDTTLPEVADYNKIYEEDVTAKVQVYIREDGSEYNLYLKTDRTTTTNKDDPDRASGKIEVISVETADRAAEEALNVMKGNNYKHLVEFKIAKTSKLMDITELHIGRPIRIKTDDDIYDSYISAITLSDENFVYFKSGSLRITLLDKLKASNNSVGNKLDVTGGKILGNLNILDNAYFGKDGVSFGAPYDEDKGGPLQLDGARIIESGSNSNGSYIKFSDGTMICYMNKLYSNINITKAWGSMYETDPINLGNFPANFVNIPTVTATCTGGSTVFIEAFTPSETSLGASWFARPSALANTETIISFIAIGKWK